MSKYDKLHKECRKKLEKIIEKYACDFLYTQLEDIWGEAMCNHLDKINKFALKETKEQTA